MLKCGGGGDGRLLKAILDRRHGISGASKPRRAAVPGLSHPSGPAFPGAQFQRPNGIVYDPSPVQEIAKALKSGLAAPGRPPGNGAGGVTVE